MHQAHERITAAYDPKVLAEASSAWREVLIDHFQQLATGQPKALNWREPAENIRAAATYVDSPALADEALSNISDQVTALVREMLRRGQNLHHPRYVGHQVPASLPLAGLFDAVGTLTNQVMAIYEMGPWATAVERVMVDRLGIVVGYPPNTFAGVCTHGGSLANLTALLTARNVSLGDAWTAGVYQEQQPVLIVQNDAHYCVTRAAGILGLGTQNIIKIPVDAERRMQVGVLDSTLQELRQKRTPVVAVVASACGTPIGAFDPLNAIADVCQRHEVWMHVDAAHGGTALMSQRHRHLLAGIERADSLVWDAHKMLFMPALCAFIFYKNADHRFAAFEQDAPYLFDPTNPGVAEYDSGTQTVECTKRALAFGLWGTWALLGQEFFGDLVDVTFALVRRLHEMLTAAPDFTPLHLPECNIQVFRYTPPQSADWSDEQLGEFQLRLRRKVITSGEAYLVPIKLNGIGALRMTLMNPTTTESDIRDVLDSIRRHGKKLLGR